jgi:hypothetical protein
MDSGGDLVILSKSSPGGKKFVTENDPLQPLEIAYLPMEYILILNKSEGAKGRIVCSYFERILLISSNVNSIDICVSRGYY